MESSKYNWSVGEIASLTWNERLLKKSGSTSYAELVSSQHICIREATDMQPGILLKVMGKVPTDRIMLINGKPFCKDDRDDLFKGKCYYSYPFPTADTLKEVLEIVSSNEALKSRLKAESMNFNPASSFWIRETAGKFLTKKPQYYDAGSGQILKAADNAAHYRLTIAYFQHDELSW